MRLPPFSGTQLRDRPGRTLPIVRCLIPLALTTGAVAAAILTWAWSDVLLWQRIFESKGLWRFDGSYQTGHESVLIGLIVLGSLLLIQSGIRWSIAYAAAVYTLAYGGLADVLYYLLDGRPIPATLPWLDQAHPLILFHPVTAAGLVASAAIWIAAWIGLLGVGSIVTLVRPVRRRRRRTHALADARATS